MITILDRYLGVQILRPFAASIAIVIMLLSLENSARLMGQLKQLEQPIGVLMRFMGYLIPEYLGVGIIFAVFIGASIAFRGIALSGELDVFSAIGMPSLRLLRMPILLAIAGSILFVTTRGYLEPWGERQLDTLGQMVKAGELGIAIEANSFYSPAPNIVFHADRIDSTTKTISGIMVKIEEMTVFAKSGVAINHGHGDIILILKQGHAISVDSKGRHHVITFEQMRLRFSKEREQPSGAMTVRQMNDRRSLYELYQNATESGSAREKIEARAGLAGRLVAAFAIPILPLLALGLSVPPKRQNSAFGIGIGVIILVCFIQAAHAIEETASNLCLLQFTLLWVALAAITGFVWRCHVVYGPGFVEGKLHWLVQPIITEFGRLRKLF
jgi:lipopolysaccharide export system permease protein